MKKITISILLFLQSSSFINLKQKHLAISGDIDPAHEAESRTGEAIRFNLICRTQAYKDFHFYRG
jgi:hypothetical protein